jgi:ubiquinone/menaquinone biosynthesis C-methylase UbiE
MFNRRQLLPLASAMAAMGTLLTGRSAEASTRDIRFDPYQMPEAMKEKYSIRMPTLDRQAAEDFYGSFRLAMASQYSDLGRDVDATLAHRGVNANQNCSLEEAWNLCLLDPRFAMKARTWVSGQQLMWNAIRDSFHEHSGEILAALEATDRSGPGTLELNPNLAVPESCRHEIHIQPGGYVGDAFSGAIAAYGSKHFGRANVHLYNDHQERHLQMAQEMPLPEDGEVHRILDMGTGWGSLATALKERFPDAEVWGIDVGGPMVRWAHYRAVKLGMDIHFAQRLAEETKFADNSFDIVTSYIMHHEVTGEASRKIVAEAFRVLRPGGVFKPIDFVTVGNPSYRAPETLTAKAGVWQDHRYNNEVWALEWKATDLPALMLSTGFVEVEAGAKPGGAFGEVIGIKPA